MFIALLAAVTTAIAGAAAYFSVYGLAYTFSGVFWSVVVMGASLEAGKLIAASFLYRYWTRLGGLLKGYLCFGVVALMILTSTGIFGYLSTGYQQDILPLKQKTEQVNLLEADKTRALARKQQIDDLLAGNTTSTNITSSDKTAARNLAAASKNRAELAKQYNAEQVQVTKRVADLDEQLLTLKQDLIKTEAHIGPITYVAKAFNLPTDDATKYLIFLIIFTFDPMAVALTLCVNMAIRWKQEDDKKQKESEQPDPVPEVLLPDAALIDAQPDEFTGMDDDQVDIGSSIEFMDEDEPPQDIIDAMKVSDVPVELELLPIEQVEPPIDYGPKAEHHDVEPEVVEPVEEPLTSNLPPPPPPEVQQPEVISPYGPIYQPRARIDPDKAKIAELVSHLRMIKSKQSNGMPLSKDEEWELHAIENVLHKNGYDKYI